MTMGVIQQMQLDIEQMSHCVKVMRTDLRIMVCEVVEVICVSVVAILI